MGGWAKEIEVRSFDFLDVEPIKERGNYDNEFVVIPCCLKVKVQSVLRGAGDTANRTIDVCNQFGNTDSWSRVENIGGQQPQYNRYKNNKNPVEGTCCFYDFG